MKHVTYADKGIFTGDDIADALIEYAAALAGAGKADTAEISAYSSDGAKVRAKMLLGAGAPLMAETVHTDLPEPDNAEVLEWVREQMRFIEHPPPARAVEPQSLPEQEIGEW